MMGDQGSLAGMYTGAKQGIDIYLKHLDDIHDAKALGIIRRNLENKQDEIEWLEEQMAHGETPAIKQVQADRKDKIEAEMAVQEKQVSKGGLFGLPIWILLAGIAAGIFVFLRRQSEPDFGDEAFQYEAEEFGGESASGYDGERQYSTPTV
jgi:hypothetical protein